MLDESTRTVGSKEHNSDELVYKIMNKSFKEDKSSLEFLPFCRYTKPTSLDFLDFSAFNINYSIICLKVITSMLSTRI